ncbi:MAG: trypsin-like peptidase domain-containing protein [Actinomycetota bacterium]|nr:trypsin-like peptidase domain-containing protein [Actinomycetota bacterium]
MRRRLAFVAALVAAGLVGGGAALAVGSQVWGGETTTVQVRQDDPAGATPVSSFDDDASAGTIGDVYRDAAPGVVQVKASLTNVDPFGRAGGSLGSGFVIDKDGHVVTNYHVVQEAEDVYVSFSNEDQLEARVVGTDPSTDLALLKIDVDDKRALAPLALGDSDSVQVGDSVIAIGSPYGRARTVTAGIVSALQRQIQAPNGFAIDKVIQTDAPINRGNSGGPLLNARGEVVGVNAQILSENGGNVGIGFAIPVNTVKEVAAELIEHGHVEHPYLGVSIQTIGEQVAERFDLPESGVVVTDVFPGSPADRAGIRGGDTPVVVGGESYLLGGDVIAKADGRTLESADEFLRVIRSKEPGDKLTLDLIGDDAKRTVTVELVRQPASTSR